MRRSIPWAIMIFALFAIVECGGGGSEGKTVKLYGATAGNILMTGSELVLLSPDDGSFISTIGSIGFQVNGLEYDSVSKKLYATTTASDPSYKYGLIEINMETGVSSAIGPGGVAISNLTANSSGEMFAWEPNGEWLLAVDNSTGIATSVGKGSPGTFFTEFGLAFDNSDTLYMIDGNGGIHTINSLSGAATFTSTIGTRAHHGDFHPETGHYWGIDITADAGPAARSLLVVDVNTPSVVDTLSTADHLHVITFFRD